jgi:hypothetical protein
MAQLKDSGTRRATASVYFCDCVLLLFFVLEAGAEKHRHGDCHDEYWVAINRRDIIILGYFSTVLLFELVFLFV